MGEKRARATEKDGVIEGKENRETEMERKNEVKEFIGTGLLGCAKLTLWIFFHVNYVHFSQSEPAYGRYEYNFFIRILALLSTLFRYIPMLIDSVVLVRSHSYF